jgi:hypothetical protein
MTNKQFNAIVARVVARRKRTTFSPPTEGKGNNATADRHAEYGAARH